MKTGIRTCFLVNFTSAKLYFFIEHFLISPGGGQNLERHNVERPVFRNFKIANIKIKKNELFDNFIFELFLHFLENI